jgi:hypothetical protein
VASNSHAIRAALERARVFRNELVAADGLDQQRPACPAEVKRLGDHPVIVQLRTGSATVDVAAHDEESQQLLGPFRESVAVGRHPSAPPDHSSQAAPIGAHANGDRTRDRTPV